MESPARSKDEAVDVEFQDGETYDLTVTDSLKVMKLCWL